MYKYAKLAVIQIHIFGCLKILLKVLIFSTSTFLYNPILIRIKMGEKHILFKNHIPAAFQMCEDTEILKIEEI